MPNERVFSVLIMLVTLCGCAAPNTALNQDVPNSVNRDNPSCLVTGSRLSTSANCSTFGHSYSNEDISRTGSPTAAGSLRLLDPSITIH